MGLLLFGAAAKDYNVTSRFSHDFIFITKSKEYLIFLDIKVIRNYLNEI